MKRVAVPELCAHQKKIKTVHINSLQERECLLNQREATVKLAELELLHRNEELAAKLAAVSLRETVIEHAQRDLRVRFEAMSRSFRNQQMQYESRGYTSTPTWIE